MDEFTAALRRERAARALLPLFFVSGATGLVYQTLWARRLHLLFGTSTLAVTTVLAVFMGGLAVGGLWMARRADTTARPLAIYGWLEVGIGLFALAFQTLLDGVMPVWVGVGRAFDPSPLGLALVQFAVVGALLIVPTAMMGATLPLLARFATDRLGAAGDRVGTLYGVNTLGAVFGTWLAGFVLLPALGWQHTHLGAAGANLLLGAAALALARWARGTEWVPVLADAAPGGGGEGRIALVLFLSGFAALVYEVAWTRVIGLVVGGSAYAFSIMLLAFLIGLAGGGLVGGRLADAVLARRGHEAVVALLAGAQVVVGLLAWATLFLFPELPFLYVRLFDAWEAEVVPAAMWPVAFVVAGLVMIPPTVVMGASFPIAVRIVVRDPDALGGPVGRLYGANTLGSLLGAFAAGFVFVPLVGLRGAVVAGVLVNAAAAVTLAWRLPTLRVAAPIGLAAGGLALAANVVQAPWDPMMMTSGLYKYASSFDDHSREGIRRFTKGTYELVSYEEGLGSVVTVVRNRETGNLWLANNGKVDASSVQDMPTQVLLAALPLLFVEAPRDVLVIGLASGATAGAAAMVPAVERLDVVEIEPAVARAARLFGPYNRRVLDDPRTRLHLADGRQVLQVAPPASWDVVISEPPNPWITGVSNLFTREFFEIGRARVRPGGVWSQWVQTYALDPRDLRSLLATFASVWPHVALYVSPTRNDLVLLGSERPLPAGPPASERPWRAWPELARALSEVRVPDAAALTALSAMDDAAVRGFAGDAPLNTDDNMRVEYSAPLSLHRATGSAASAAMVSWRRVPYDAFQDDPDGLAALAFAYRARKDWARAVMALREAASAASEPDASAWAETAALWEQELRALLRGD